MRIERRRALFLSYYTPPRPGVATTRTRQLLHYLPQFGWDVTAVTARLDGAASDVVQTEYVDLAARLKQLAGLGTTSAHAALGTAAPAVYERPTLRQRAVAAGYAMTTYPDAQVGWFTYARAAVRKLLQSGQFDAVLSSSPPFTSNLVLGSLRTNVPWIADFRDLWSAGNYGGTRFRGRLDAMLARWTARRVAAFTTITEEMAAELRAAHPGIDVYAIANAFDPQEWESIPFEREDRTTFVYAGQLYAGRRDPRPLLRAVRAVLDRGDIAPEELRIDFYSAREPWLESAIAEHRLEDVVRIAGVVPRDAVLAAERRADRLLVLLWDGANAEGIVTGKIFEYLGARRPVLATGGPLSSAVDEVLQSTNAGVRARDAGSIEREIVNAVREHRAGAVRILDPQPLEKYNAAAMAQRFAAVLDRHASLAKQ